MNEVELDVTAAEINSNFERMIDDSIATGRELRSGGMKFPPQSVGALYIEMANAADAGADRKELRQKNFKIMDIIAQAILEGKIAC